MKLKTTATITLLALGLTAVRAEDKKITVPGITPAPAAPAAAPAAPAFTEAQIVEEFGWFVGKRVGLTELEFTPAEIAGTYLFLASEDARPITGQALVVSNGELMH